MAELCLLSLWMVECHARPTTQAPLPPNHGAPGAGSLVPAEARLALGVRVELPRLPAHHVELN